MTLRLILDCDPGLDDALALVLAQGDPELDLAAVTTVGGNVSLDRTTRNALQLREYLGFDKVPVASGAAGPLHGPTVTAAEVHGETGLGNVTLPEPTLALSDIPAVELIISTLQAAPGQIHLVATGPLTNIALALRAEPRIVEWAASFIIMGGSFTRGNVTPAAEFNIYADPVAAAEVFAAGWTVVMIGLDLTHQAIAHDRVVQRMQKLGRLGQELLAPLATFWVGPDAASPEAEGQALHDVCAVAYLGRPDLFTAEPARVEIETTGTFTLGETVVDFKSATPNAIVATRLDVDGFWDYVHAAWANIHV